MISLRYLLLNFALILIFQQKFGFNILCFWLNFKTSKSKAGDAQLQPVVEGQLKFM